MYLKSLDYQTFFFNEGPNSAKGDSFLNRVDGRCMDGDAVRKLAKESDVDKSENVFKAQFKGVYFFSHSAPAELLAKNGVYVILMKNGNVVSSGFHIGSNLISRYPIGIKATLVLEPGDKVSIVKYIMDKEYSADDPLQLELSHGTFHGFQLTSLH